jgi:hypothetical protein
MTLDADAVLWALRGLQGVQGGGGACAEDVAHFLSKDATLSDEYGVDDVTEVLESLVDEGTLALAVVGDGGDESRRDLAFYRFSSDPDPGPLHAPLVEVAAPRPRLGTGPVPVGSVIPEVLAEAVDVRVEGMLAAVAREAEATRALRVEMGERERERDALVEERDRWRARSDAVAEELARVHDEAAELRARVRELEQLLELERSSGMERSDAAHRAAAAIAHAQRVLERIEPTPSDSRGRPRAISHRRPLRGNWLDTDA